MSLINELLTQTYLTSANTALGLDLNNIDFDLINVTFDTNTNYINQSETASFLIDDFINYNDYTKTQTEIDFIHFDENLISSVCTNTESEPESNQSTLDFNIFDLANSPSDETTYGNVCSIDQADDLSMMSCSILSPASSTDNQESRGLRRTRSRTIDKKESNKVAAIKYRTKKLKEKDQLFAECQIYAKKNDEMRKKILDCQSEISFIKSLLVEALIAKNGLSV